MERYNELKKKSQTAIKDLKQSHAAALKEASSNASADELAKVTAERDALLAKSNDDASAELASTKRKLDAVVERYKQHKAQGKAAIEELQRRLKEAGSTTAPEGGDKEKEKALRKQVMELRRELAKAKRDARATRARRRRALRTARAAAAPDAAVSAELERGQSKSRGGARRGQGRARGRKKQNKGRGAEARRLRDARESRGQAS